MKNSQIQEILYKLEVRMETVQNDPESGDEFELIPGALQELEKKLKKLDPVFTEPEIKWMVEELEWAIEMADPSGELGLSKSERAARRRYMKDMQQAIDEILNS